MFSCDRASSVRWFRYRNNIYKNIYEEWLNHNSFPEDGQSWLKHVADVTKKWHTWPDKYNNSYWIHYFHQSTLSRVKQTKILLWQFRVFPQMVKSERERERERERETHTETETERQIGYCIHKMSQWSYTWAFNPILQGSYYVPNPTHKELCSYCTLPCLSVLFFRLPLLQ